MAAPRATRVPPERKTVRHPLFGSIPLVEVERTAADGQTHRRLVFDPGYRPPLPPGAVRGDIRRQIFCCDTPRYFYVDQQKRCRACGEPFVFTGREQRHWYETLGFRLDATAVRCAACRRRFRQERGVSRALSDASRALAEAPLHRPAVIGYARAAVAHAERFGHAPLDVALAQVRSLRAADPEAVESLFWEARCHEAAGRSGKAALALERFLAVAGRRRGLAAETREAARRLADLAGPAGPASRRPGARPAAPRPGEDGPP